MDITISILGKRWLSCRFLVFDVEGLVSHLGCRAPSTLNKIGNRIALRMEGMAILFLLVNNLHLQIIGSSDSCMQKRANSTSTSSMFSKYSTVDMC